MPVQSSLKKTGAFVVRSHPSSATSSRPNSGLSRSSSLTRITHEITHESPSKSGSSSASLVEQLAKMQKFASKDSSAKGLDPGLLTPVFENKAVLVIACHSSLPETKPHSLKRGEVVWSFTQGEQALYACESDEILDSLAGGNLRHRCSVMPHSSLQTYLRFNSAETPDYAIQFGPRLGKWYDGVYKYSCRKLIPILLHKFDSGGRQNWGKTSDALRVALDQKCDSVLILGCKGTSKDASESTKGVSSNPRCKQPTRLPSMVFIGNPGTGKSSTMNCYVGKAIFTAGCSITGVGVTVVLSKEEHDGRFFFDTPGLSDLLLREKAAIAIKEALQHGGDFNVCFALTTESGRVRPDDLTTMKLVLDACGGQINENEFCIFINKCKKTWLRKVQNDKGAFVENLKEQMSLKGIPTTSFVHFAPVVEAMDDEEDVVVELDEETMQFLNSMPVIHINSDSIQDIKHNEFEELQQEMERMAAENEKKFREAQEEANMKLAEQQKRADKKMAKSQDEMKKQLAKSDREHREAADRQAVLFAQQIKDATRDAQKKPCCYCEVRIHPDDLSSHDKWCNAHPHRRPYGVYHTKRCDESEWTEAGWVASASRPTVYSTWCPNYQSADEEYDVQSRARSTVVMVKGRNGDEIEKSAGGKWWRLEEYAKNKSWRLWQNTKW